jgi:hypothetical protein
MDYKMDAQTGYLNLQINPLGDPKARVEACEKEIASALEKHGCILIIQVAAKDQT